MTIFTMKNRIMLGVYLMYCMRKLKSPFATEIFTLAILGIALSLFVSIPSVLSNVAESSNSARYFAIAFSHTETLVQSLIILAFATMVFSLRNFGSIVALRHPSSVGRAPLS